MGGRELQWPGVGCQSPGGLKEADTRKGGWPGMGCKSLTWMRTLCPRRDSPAQGAEAQWSKQGGSVGRLPRAGQDGGTPADGQADGMRRLRRGSMQEGSPAWGTRAPGMHP